MKKLLYTLTLMAAVFASCNDYETYGDKKEKERNAIAKFVADSSFTIISEDQFVKNGCKTDLQNREFVKLDKSGVYMQIVRQGCGTAIQDGESTTLVCRYSEYDIMNDTISTCNNDSEMYFNKMPVISIPDVMKISRSSGSYTASFTSGIMYTVYSSNVPAGWLTPMPYIKVGRPQSMDEECAKVRLIVPHTQGHTTASGNVKPYFYEITFERQT